MRDHGPLTAFFVAAAALAAYATSLPGTFQYDDLPTIVQNVAVQDPGNLPVFFEDPTLFSSIPGNRMYRPVLMASYVLDYAIAGYRPFAWTLTNILLHALAAVLVSVLARRLLVLLRPKSPDGPAPFLAGLAFALHPVHTEVVNYVSSRSGSLATVGFLAALILHLSWTRAARSKAHRFACLLGSLFFLGLGLGAKEIAVAIVPVVLVLELLDPDAGPVTRRIARAVLRTVPVLVFCVGYLAVRKAVLGSAVTSIGARFFEVAREDPFDGGGRTVFQNLLTQARVFWIYVKLMFLPVGLAVDHFVRVSTSFGEPVVLASFAGLAVFSALLLKFVRTNPFVTFCGAIFVFGLAPTSSVIPLNVVMNEHRLYLPGVGFAMLTGLILAGLMRRWPRAGPTLAAAVGLAYLAVLVPRNLTWQDPRALWEDNVRVDPGSFRAHNQLGANYYAEAAAIGPVPDALSLIDRAIAEYQIAEQIYPSWFSVQLNLGIAYRERARIRNSDADFEKALEHFENCRRVSRNEWRARYQIATTYGAWRRYKEAIRRFTEMAERDRTGEDLHRLPIYLFPLAKLNLERGELVEAEKLYREILDVAPGDVDGHACLANALSKAGRQNEGIEVFRRLIARYPEDPRVFILFAEFLYELGDPKGAAALFNKALTLGHRPVHVEVEKYLGR